MSENEHNTENYQGIVSETRFSLLDQRVSGIETAVDRLTSKIDSWMASRNQNPWKVIALLLGILVPLGFILNLYITSAISPVAAMANQSKATADDQRDTMKHAIEVQTGILQQFARVDAERMANEREVETQIDAMNQSLSVQFANQQRTNADHQNALHDLGAKYPAASGGPFYFPNISNRNHRK